MRQKPAPSSRPTESGSCSTKTLSRTGITPQTRSVSPPGHSFEVTNPEAEEAEDACDWDVISEYEENGDVIEAEAAKTLIGLVRFWR